MLFCFRAQRLHSPHPLRPPPRHHGVFAVLVRQRAALIVVLLQPLVRLFPVGGGYRIVSTRRLFLISLAVLLISGVTAEDRKNSSFPLKPWPVGRRTHCQSSLSSRVLRDLRLRGEPKPLDVSFSLSPAKEGDSVRASSRGQRIVLYRRFFCSREYIRDLEWRKIIR